LFLLGALVAYSGAGGVANIVLSNWARDKGYGMSTHAGYIPGAVGGSKVSLAHSGFTFAASGDAMRRWRGWWRLVRVDQRGIFAIGAVLGMMLPALIYVAFLPPGTDIQGLGISAGLASSVGPGPVRFSARASRSSARGSCSRRSSTTSKAWSARLPTCAGRAAAGFARGATAMSGVSTTA